MLAIAKSELPTLTGVKFNFGSKVENMPHLRIIFIEHHLDLKSTLRLTCLEKMIRMSHPLLSSEKNLTCRHKKIAFISCCETGSYLISDQLG